MFSEEKIYVSKVVRDGRFYYSAKCYLLMTIQLVYGGKCIRLCVTSEVAKFLNCFLSRSYTQESYEVGTTPSKAQIEIKDNYFGLQTPDLERTSE